MTNKDISAIITDKENKLLEELRKVTYGRVVVFMENGQPVRIEEVRKSVKL